MSDYAKIEDLLEELFELINDCKATTFFGGKVIDKEIAFGIINDIRMNLPQEIKEAKKIIDNANKIIQDADYRAGQIIKQAEEIVEKLISEHEITKMARERDEQAKLEIQEYVRNMRIGTLTYADNCLINIEKELQESLNKLSNNFRVIEEIISNEINTIYQNRQELRQNE